MALENGKLLMQDLMQDWLQARSLSIPQPGAFVPWLNWRILSGLSKSY